MTATSRSIPRALLAPLVLALWAAFAWPAAAVAAPQVPAKRPASSPDSVREYWTPKRMREAEPAEGLLEGIGVPPAADAPGASPSILREASFVGPSSPGAPAPARMVDGSPSGSERVLGIGVVRDEIVDPAAPEVRAHGKVFFTIPQGSEAGDYVCSGTAVNSRNRSVVWTAGHCIFDYATGGGFASKWTFVPGYRDGAKPFGEWPAKVLQTTPGWRSAANLRYDVGAAIVTKNAAGQRLQSVVGARGIGFDQPRDQLYSAFGYPAEAPPVEFTGEREFRCISNQERTDQPVGSGPATMAIKCDMTAGSSGGGWIVDTTLLSVTSYGYLTDPDLLYGPYLSTSAKELYTAVKGKKKKRRRAGTKGGKGGRHGGGGGR